MARMVMGNAFSLLDDEEGDDSVMVVVNRLVKKADREAQSSQADEDSQSTDDWGKYTRGGHGEVFYEDTESKNAKEDVNGRDENQAENDDGGDWQEVSKPKGKGSVNQEHINGNSLRSYKNGNGNGNSNGERRFHRKEVQGDNQRNLKGSVKEGRKFGDEEKPNRNGNSNNNGYEKRGYGGAKNRGGGFRRTDNGEVRVETDNSGDANHLQNSHNGNEKRGNGRYRGRSRGEYQRVDNGEVRRTENGGDVKNNVDEDRTYRNGNSNYGYERRGYGENRRRGRGGFRRNDNGEERQTGNVAAVENNADADHLNGSSGGDAAAAVSEVSGDVETEGKKASEGINGGTSDSKWKPERKLTKEQEARKKEREEYKQKKMEEEEQDAGLMTLAQYEKKLSEKRKALESMKAEERKVTLDKDLEHMRPVEKKQDDIFFEPISEEKSEEELKKKDSRNKEKGRKAVAVDVAEFLKPASYRRGGGGGGGGGDFGSGRGRGRGQGKGRGGAGGRGGYRGGYPATTRDGHTNNDAHKMANATTGAVSDSILEEDFPVLGVAKKI